ncbi:hypothetical protein ACIPSE_32600 [Streptomyces sp. NPDC090106]|uniref:hypothetical protein n=1 Tax=Streptomyces sp. NPDC090106 TaxID=3365946 RepID=UPI00380168C6
MEMNHREPPSGRPAESAEPDRPAGSAGAPGGQAAVWESELPWDFPPPEEHPATTPAAGVAAPADADEPDTRLTPAPAHHRTHDVTTSAARPRTSGERGDRGERAGRGERGSRLRLSKPVLAGAGVLSALFLLVPHFLNEDAPSQAVQAGAEDTDPEATPYADGTDDVTAAPSPKASSGTPAGDDGKGGHDRIDAVAATAPTESGRPVTVLSEPRATGTTTSAATPRSATTTANPTPSTQWTSTAIQGTSVLEAGQTWSTNRIVLAFQGDGNLVLYDKAGTPLWWSGTAGQGGVKAVFQADGNLAVYAGDSRTVWSSRTDGHDGARLVLRADGNMVIVQGGTVLWSTGTTM